MRFRIDVKLKPDGPWKPRCVTVEDAYASVEQLLSFLAWFRAQDSQYDYRGKRLWTVADIERAEEECKHEIH